jgi:imidazolonepropionase-like amidohydrolase
MWAIRGRIVPLTSEPTVAPNEAAAFTGPVWIGDEGTIITVTKGTKARPPDSESASVIDVGSSLVLPGLIDLHNHLG